MHGKHLLMNNPFTATLDGERCRFVPDDFNPAVKKRVGRPRVKSRWEQSFDAQFFVGMNVDGEPTWTPEQVRDKVIEMREDQIRVVLQAFEVPASEAKFSFGGSVTPILGFWTVFGRDEEPREKSVSVVIAYIPNDYEDLKTFKKNMEQIALELADDFQQDSVLLRFAKNGQVVENVEIGWGTS